MIRVYLKSLFFCTSYRLLKNIYLPDFVLDNRIKYYWDYPGRLKMFTTVIYVSFVR